MPSHKASTSALPDEDALRLVPLGGLGEVGMNCMAVEARNDVFALDCGVTFPDKTFGADIEHARFDYLVERADRLRAIVLTHGHEDHVGAVPYLLREVDVPVYGPPYALEILKKRLEEVEVEGTPELRPFASGRSFGIGDDFEIEPFAVHHSLPDAHGLVIRSPAGTVVHTGDFKIEKNPIHGQRFDRQVLDRARERGVRLMLSDSTNIDVAGRSGTEADVATGLERLVTATKHRVVISTFSSNSYRLQTLLELAKKTRRKVALFGRSMWTHARIQEQLGHLDGLSKLVVPKERIRSVPRSELMIIATGSQGEPVAALARLARGAHPDLELEAGDTVLLSARVIPGSELSVYALCDALERRGVEVHHRKTDDIHASGHGAREEQREMLEIIRPRSFVPVHGTFHHLVRHAALARETGVQDTLIIENGCVLELTPDTLRVVGKAPVGRVQRADGDAIPDIVLRDRTLIAQHGIAFAAIPVSRDLDRIGLPRIVTRGIFDEADPDDDELIRDAEDYLANDLRDRLGDFDRLDDVRQSAIRALRRFFQAEIGRKPIVSIAVLPT